MPNQSRIQLTDSLKSLYLNTAKKLKGSDRRQFMANLVAEWGIGGATFAERELGWNRRTIRKGMEELTHGISIADSFRLRGRKPIEHKLPNLLSDIRSLVEPHSQTDPSFKTTNLYTRISAAKVRALLIEQKGYTDEQLPCQETIRCRLNEMGYKLKRVIKGKPKKKIPETKAIFEQIFQVNSIADNDPYTLRISMDAKVAVKVGELDRGGKTRVKTISEDHDFDSKAKITPYGIFVPEYNELYLFFVSSKLTADCIVDLLEDWWQEVKVNFPHLKKLVINQDNGPENNSRRTQFMKRVVDFAYSSGLQIQLAYYPPYHSKYNPVERTFGWLEQHWNGSLLNTIETVIKFAESLTFKGKQPVVKLIEKVYKTGVKLTSSQMKEVEKKIKRCQNLGKWFVEIMVNST